MSDAAEILETLRASGALKRGHFLLSSGRHSDQYIEKFDLLRNPNATSAACVAVADRFRGTEIDVVVGPTTGGVVLAFEVARQLGVAAAYAERATPPATGREFRRGTNFAQGTRALVVDDILTTGGSLRETLVALAGHEVEVVGTVVLVDRSGGQADLPGSWMALSRVDADSWDATECPLCAAGLPLEKPGTTPTRPKAEAQEPAAPG